MQQLVETTYSDLILLLADVIRARVRTLGIEEHHLIIEKGQFSFACHGIQSDKDSGVDAGAEVYITDVGGSRNMVSLLGVVMAFLCL